MPNAAYMKCHEFLASTTWSNPDIAGIGVRTAFYIQVFLIVTSVHFSPKTFINAWIVLVSMSVGLFIAVGVSTARKQLSLFDALELDYLLWLSNQAMMMCAVSKLLFSPCPPVSVMRHYMPEILMTASSGVMLAAKQIWIRSLWDTRFQHSMQNAECIPYMPVFGAKMPSFEIVRAMRLETYTDALAICASGTALLLVGSCIWAIASKLDEQEENDSLIRTLKIQGKWLGFLCRRRTPLKISPLSLLGLALITVPLAGVILANEQFLKEIVPESTAANLDAVWSIGQITAVVAIVPGLGNLRDVIAQRMTDEEEYESSLAVLVVRCACMWTSVALREAYIAARAVFLVLRWSRQRRRADSSTSARSGTSRVE